jgi:hypothetical protein
MKKKTPPPPRIPEPRKRPTVIVLEDYTDADQTVQRSPVYASDLPQFDLEPICDPVDTGEERAALGDSVSAVVLADLVPARKAPASVPPMAFDAVPSADASAEHYERKLQQNAWRFRAAVASALLVVTASVWVGVQSRAPLAEHVPAATVETPLQATSTPISGDALTAAIDEMHAKTGIMNVDAAPGRDVYVDGAVAGVTPEPVRAPCGEHVVQIGRNGALHNVMIPCGGEVAVR